MSISLPSATKAGRIGQSRPLCLPSYRDRHSSREQLIFDTGRPPPPLAHICPSAPFHNRIPIYSAAESGRASSGIHMSSSTYVYAK